MGGGENSVEYEEERALLIESLKRHGISERVLSAMREVPRHLFVPENRRNQAYVDSPLPIGHSQTISAPHMVAIMCDLLDLKEGQKVLEIGAGSGYNAAVMSRLVGNTGMVYSIERIEALADFAQNNLMNAGYNNVKIILDDGSLGYPQEAPFDRICVTASAPDTPQPLVDQLRSGGLMVIPEGDSYQQLFAIKKKADGTVTKEEWGGVIFVPMIGKYGFDV
ncbi:protein-L-isoaspartate O-methyltransferase [Methanolobus sp. ZRKC3]|uniref:protein-L-isoaspartate O-methyltransferase n=1 Tax=Methanolobus sp. ZRKC3 TaxID=3125786 RepID=UPI003245616C